MNLHYSWEKMLVFKHISNFENNRIKKQIAQEKYQVNISNKRIFKELSYVFAEIQGYKNLYIKLFEDMSSFDFIDTDSVTDAHGEQVSKYKKIRLYDHTLNTFYKMVEILHNDKNLIIQKDIFLLIALLHDFGKSHKLCENYEIDLENAHHVRSANYFNEIVLNSIDNYGLDQVAFKTIYGTLNEHHEIISSRTEETIYMKLLKEADGMARKTEEALLKELEEKEKKENGGQV